MSWTELVKTQCLPSMFKATNFDAATKLNGQKRGLSSLFRVFASDSIRWLIQWLESSLRRIIEREGV